MLLFLLMQANIKRDCIYMYNMISSELNNMCVKYEDWGADVCKYMNTIIIIINNNKVPQSTSTLVI